MAFTSEESIAHSRSTPKTSRFDPTSSAYRTPNEDRGFHMPIACELPSASAPRKAALNNVGLTLAKIIEAFDLAMWQQPTRFSGGTTVSVLLVFPQGDQANIITAHAGDSPLYWIGEKHCDFLNAKTRHSVERDTIPKVSTIPESRFIWGSDGYRFCGRTEMYRSIGDFSNRPHGGSAMPTVIRHKRPKTGFVIAASDAISDDLKPADIHKIIHNPEEASIAEKLECAIQIKCEDELLDDTTTVALNLADLEQPYCIGVADGHASDMCSGAIYSGLFGLFMENCLSPMLEARLSDVPLADFTARLETVLSKFKEEAFADPYLTEVMTAIDFSLFKKTLELVLSEKLGTAILGQRLQSFISEYIKDKATKAKANSLVELITSGETEGAFQQLGGFLTEYLTLTKKAYLADDFAIIFNPHNTPEIKAKHALSLIKGRAMGFIQHVKAEQTEKDTSMTLIQSAKSQNEVVLRLTNFARSHDPRGCCTPFFEMLGCQSRRVSALCQDRFGAPTREMIENPLHSATTDLKPV